MKKPRWERLGNGKYRIWREVIPNLLDLRKENKTIYHTDHFVSFTGRGFLYRLWKGFLWKVFHINFGGCKINGKPDVHIKLYKIK